MPYKVTRCVMLAGFSCRGVCVRIILNVLVASTSSGRVAAVILEESTKSFIALHRPLTLRAPGHKHENAIPLALMGALRMIMRQVFRERVSQGAFTKQDQLGQRFLFDGSYPPFRIGIQIGRPRWQWHTRDPVRVNHVLKGWTILAVAVMNKILAGNQEAPIGPREVARDLHHPALIGMGCHARHVHLAAREVEKKEHVIRDQAARRPDLSGEEVRGHEYIHVHTDKLLPRRGFLAFRGWWNAMALENVPHSLIADRITQMPQSPHNAVIAPRAILLGETHDQGLEFWIDLGASKRLALLGSVKLLRDELPMPCQNLCLQP